ncbi:MAG: serine/threonine protein kinase [Deltaproteobacteria bacterium]|nr:MAG: serine/threonine protein kinase [Deltaproteobacteria bacterium]
MAASSATLAPCPSCGALHPEDVLVCPSSGQILPLEGRILDGKFRILSRLGEGGMGTVYRAENVLVAREVAIKLLHPEYARDPTTLERFRKEATAAGRIRNPHICDIFDFGRSAAGPYIVMELLSGRSFGALIEQLGRVEPGLCVLIVRQALEGLAAAHEAGIIHRDLKPENIFLHEPEPGRLLVKLMDFGISKFTQDGGGGRTRQGVLMGTPEYMSPEQAAGAAGVDARTDIWSMGVIMYFALSGVHPFLGSTLAATLANVTMHDPRPLVELAPDVPGDLAKIVHRCLEKDRERRIASARALRDLLAPFEPDLGTSTMAAAMAPTVAATAGAASSRAPASPAAQLLAEARAASLAGADGTPMPPAPPSAGVEASSSWVSEVPPIDDGDDGWTLRGSQVDVTRPESTLDGGGRRRWPWILAVLLLAAGGTWGVRHGLFGGSDTSGAAGVAGGGEGAAGQAAADGRAERGTTGDADASKATDGGSPSGSGSGGTGGAVGSAGTKGLGGGTGEHPTGTTGPTPAESEGSGGAQTEGGGTSPTEAKHKPRRPDLSKVTRKGRLYLATGEPMPKLNYAQAVRHCRRLARKKFGRLSKWRLPSPAELQRIHTALPDKVLYVTSQRVGDQVTFYDAFNRRTRQGPATKTARVMCVARR